MTKRSQVFSRHDDFADAAAAITGTPLRCAMMATPGANDFAGPRGPSGVIARSLPSFAARAKANNARAAPRDVEPRTVRYPRLVAMRAMISPSECSLMRIATPDPR